MAYPPVAIVDEQDKVIGAEMLAVAWEKGLYHRIVCIMVEDEQGRILLQKRATTMVLHPNYWDNSAAGHVDEGDSYEQAAQQELQEELGIENAALQEIATYRTNEAYEGRILNRFNRLYRARIAADRPIRVETEEVSEARWFTLAEIKQLIHEHPGQVTEGLQQVIREHYPG
jgi:16S rRNA (adenine1518-N6/adenine1519-N6)-dimethyltransferase